MINDKLTSKLACWALILQECDFKIIHRPGVTHQNVGTMSTTSPLSTSVDFSDVRQDFDQVAVMSPFHASTYFSLLQMNAMSLTNLWWTYGKTTTP